jgi:hypothetical protein
MRETDVVRSGDLTDRVGGQQPPGGAGVVPGSVVVVDELVRRDGGVADRAGAVCEVVQ